MADVRESSAGEGLILSGPMKKVPDDVVRVERNDGTWRFKIEFREETVPASLLHRHHVGDRLPLHSARAIRIVWDEQWMHDIPEGLEGHRYRNLAKALDATVDPGEDVVWLPESLLYAVGDDQKEHICLEPACLDSKGTQCPRMIAASVSRQLAYRVGAGEDRRPEVFNRAVEHLGKVVNDTCNSYPDDRSRMTAAMLALASSDNPYRRLMRLE